MSIKERKKDRDVCIILHVIASCLVQLQRYRTELDVALPAPLDTLAQWLQRIEAVLAEEQGDSYDHASAARNARENQQQLKVYKACQFNCFFLELTININIINMVNNLTIPPGIDGGHEWPLGYTSSVPQRR